MTWTTRMIETLTADAERCWQRMCAAELDGAKKHWTKAYNRRMAAVKYLEGRLQG